MQTLTHAPAPTLPVDAAPSADLDRLEGRWTYHDAVDVWEAAVAEQQRSPSAEGLAELDGATADGEGG